MYFNNLYCMDEDNKCLELINKSNSTLETLLTVPKACIYAFVNTKDKRIQLFSTANFSQHVSRMVDEIRTSVEYKSLYEDKQKVLLKVLETGLKEDMLRHRLGEYTKQYQVKGYTLYKDMSISLYKLHKTIVYDNRKALYKLELVSPNRSKRILLGLFNKHKDLETFMDTNYPNGIIREVIKYSK